MTFINDINIVEYNSIEMYQIFLYSYNCYNKLLNVLGQYLTNKNIIFTAEDIIGLEKKSAKFTEIISGRI